MQTHYDLSFLEGIETWGSIQKIDNPSEFFQSIDPQFWHPVTGMINGGDFEYYDDLEVYFKILDPTNSTIGFVRILNEDDTFSLHGSIIKKPSVGYKAWHHIINSTFFKLNVSILKSRVIADNKKALNFLLNTGFNISFIQEIREQYVIHLALKKVDFFHSKIAQLINGERNNKIEQRPLLIKSIQEIAHFIPEEIITSHVKYFSENTTVIYDEHLWFYCLFETFDNFHEIRVYFINEDEKIARYAADYRAYNYFVFNELCEIISRLTTYQFMLQISITKYNLAPLYRYFKYLGSSQEFLIFNSTHTKLK